MDRIDLFCISMTVERILTQAKLGSSKGEGDKQCKFIPTTEKHS